MKKFNFSFVLTGIALVIVTSFLAGCATQASSKYYGVTQAPQDKILRYISGSEPESLDPQVPTGQPEARVLMSLYDGLVEYEPKTMDPLPAIAESWEISADGTEYTFHLRKNATFSNGDPILAKDFAYSFRRALSPELAAQNAYLAYYIKYAEAYNGGKSFVKKDDGQFLLAQDLEEKKPAEDAKTETPTDVKPDVKEKTTEKSATRTKTPGDPVEKPLETEKIAEGGDTTNETEFHRTINSPMRVTVAGSPFGVAMDIKGNEKLKPYFSFKPADIKDAAGFVNKIKTGSDSFSKFLVQKIDANVLSACATAATCDDAAKQKLADSLNKLAETENFYQPEIVTAENLPEKSQKILKAFDKKNADIEAANATIETDAAQAKTDEEKAAKLKGKKPKIDKLFYVNRFLLEDVYSENLEKTRTVPITGEDIGVEAVDDYTFRMKFYQPAPFMIGLLGHQYFRVIHQGTVEKFGKDWVKPENIVTSGAFLLKAHRPYDEVIVRKNPNYWDAANVKLDGIDFYPSEEATTTMNLYKTGNVDAVYNHTTPAPWNEVIREFKAEYLNFPEVAIEYYTFNVKKAPTNDVKVRKALALSVNREALAAYRKTTKPLVDFTPEGIFPKYEEARTKIYTQELTAQGSSLEEWKARIFNTQKACDLMKEAGYKITMNGERCTVETAQGAAGRFPVEDVSITYNTQESNKAVAEFIQAQWRQNLGITVPLKNMEWKTFLKVRKAVDYNGMARAGWVGDYMDPFTFLNLFYSENNDSSTGWHDQKFDDMLDAANKETDAMKRFEILAKAELFMMQDQPVVPLQTQATNWMKKPYVKGMYPNPGTLHPWKFVYIETNPDKWDANVANIMTDKDPIVEQQIAELNKTQKAMENSKKSETTTENKSE